jgi:hypothetical protein
VAACQSWRLVGARAPLLGSFKSTMSAPPAIASSISCSLRTLTNNWEGGGPAEPFMRVCAASVEPWMPAESFDVVFTGVWPEDSVRNRQSGRIEFWIESNYSLVRKRGQFLATVPYAFSIFMA